MAINLKTIKQLDQLTNVPNTVDVIVNDANGVTKRAQLSDVLSLSNIPSAALERLVKVANQTARFALTISDVQLGDSVLQLDTNIMYVVVDTTKLNSADGYQEYKAGTAAKATSDESGNNIKSSYASSLEINNGSILLKNKNGTTLSNQSLPSTGNADVYVDTAGTIQTKLGTAPNFTLRSNSQFTLRIKNANSYNGLIKLNINGTGDKNLYINGVVSSSSNKTLTAGDYVCYYDGTNYYVETGATENTTNALVRFTSSDVADGSANSWTSVNALASGEKHSSIFAKISQMFKNVRYLYKMLGTTDISSVSTSGTVTDGLATLKQTLTQIESIDSEEFSARQRYNVKNILPIKWASQTQRGVTFTRHIDDSYSLSGTCIGNPLTIDLFSANTYSTNGDANDFNIVDGIKIDKSKPYILTRSDTQIRFTLVLYQDETSVATVGFNNTGGSSYMEIDFSQYTFNKIKAVVRFGNNTNYDGKTFKPMLCLKSDYEVSTSQQPYAKTNSQLTTVCPAMEFNIITDGYRLQFARHDGLILRFDMLTSGTNAGKFYINLIDKNGESKYYHNFSPNT